MNTANLAFLSFGGVGGVIAGAIVAAAVLIDRPVVRPWWIIVKLPPNLRRRLRHVFVAAAGEVRDEDFVGAHLRRDFQDVGDGVGATVGFGVGLAVGVGLGEGVGVEVGYWPGVHLSAGASGASSGISGKREMPRSLPRHLVIQALSASIQLLCADSQSARFR